jgi:hypothetical protein
MKIAFAQCTEVYPLVAFIVHFIAEVRFDVKRQAVVLTRPSCALLPVKGSTPNNGLCTFPRQILIVTVLEARFVVHSPVSHRREISFVYVASCEFRRRATGQL